MSHDKDYEVMRERFADLSAAMVKKPEQERRRSEALGEFDRMLRGRKITQAVVQDPYFGFVTERLVMDGNQGLRWAGAFAVRINIRSSEILCKAPGRGLGTQHPHVNAGGAPCFGTDNKTVIATLRAEGRLAELALFVVSFLEAYNSFTSLGASVTGWNALTREETERWQQRGKILARHVSVIDPGWFNPRTVDIFGLGAGGLSLALLIAKLGIENIRGCDRDVVQPENLGPSLYGWEDVDLNNPKRKVDCAARILARDAKIRLETYHGDVLDLTSYGDAVFLCLDSNDTKRVLVELWHRLGNDAPSRVFEGRVSRSNMLVHSFDPRNATHVKEWMRYYLPDSEFSPEDRACGRAQVSLGSTAITAAGLLENMFIDYVRWDAAGRETSLVNHVFFDLVTYQTKTACWD